MKTRLKPEDEVQVTPGKQAVEDLESLATPAPYSQGFTEVRNIVCIDGNGDIFEEHEKLFVELHPVLRDDVTPLETTLGEAAELCHSTDCHLPSAPLMATILTKMQEDFGNQEYQKVMWQYSGKSYANTGQPVPPANYLCNSYVDWKGHRIVHATLDGSIHTVESRDRFNTFGKDEVHKHPWLRQFAEHIVGKGHMKSMDTFAGRTGRPFYVSTPREFEDYNHVAIRCSTTSLLVDLSRPGDHIGIFRRVMLP